MKWTQSKDRKRWNANPTQFMRFAVVRFWFFGTGYVLWLNGRKFDTGFRSAYEAIRFAEDKMREHRREIGQMPDDEPTKFFRETKLGTTEACGLDAC